MKKILLLLAVAGLFFACKTAQKPNASDGGLVEIVFLQLNDVYEISPIGNENLGGMARIAAIRNDLLAKNKNVITVLAGDFISPSVIGTLKHDGKRIRGKQMVEVMNALGVDLVTFGNHEFDYDQPDLQARLDESNFTWLGTNVRAVVGESRKPFSKTQNNLTKECPDHAIFTAAGADGTVLKIGVFGGTLPSNPKPYVFYEDPVAAIRRSMDAMRGQQVDVMVGLTHFAAEDDKKLLSTFPEVPLIMGGHEHDNQIHRVGRQVLAKADANGKTVYIHTLRFNKKTKAWQVKSELKKVDASIPEDPKTAAVVTKWEKIKNESLASSGFDPSKKVVDLKTPLDCRETAVRNGQVPVGDIVGSAMLAASKTKPVCAIFNSGSIRVDDILTGTLSELDIVRMLPFGGAIVEAEMRGSLLRKTLDQGLKNAGNGGYLQWKNVQSKDNQWLIAGAALDDKKTYRVVLPEFLLTGNEMNMGFLKAEANADGKGTSNPDVVSIARPDSKDKNDLRNDIRLALINFWRM